MKQTEQQIQRAIIEYCEYQKATVVKINNVGIFNKKTSRYIPPRQKGVSDLLICWGKGKNRGRFIACEIKCGRGKPTQNQLDFIEQVKSSGGVGFCCWSVDEFIEKIKEL